MDQGYPLFQVRKQPIGKEAQMSSRCTFRVKKYIYISGVTFKKKFFQLLAKRGRSELLLSGVTAMAQCASSSLTLLKKIKNKKKMQLGTHKRKYLDTAV